jgi:hypothetical protein
MVPIGKKESSAAGVCPDLINAVFKAQRNASDASA